MWGGGFARRETGTSVLRVDTAKLHDVLDKYGIENSFELYQGTHTSKVADRFQNYVLKFFSEHLCFESRCRWSASISTNYWLLRNSA